MHARTQECDLTESLFELGLSTSYDHVMGNINSSECGQYHSENVCAPCACTMNLHEGVSITAAIDNIDHNPSSRFFSQFQHANFENETCVHKQGCVID